MTAEWKKYSDTKEINDGLANAKFGWRFIDTTNRQYGVTFGRPKARQWEFGKITHYLVCEPQPHAEMQAIWVKTGQPVEVKDPHNDEWQRCDPLWSENSEYRFAQPKKEVIYYRDYLKNLSGQITKHSICKGAPYNSPLQIETGPYFIKWLDTEWQELEV